MSEPDRWQAELRGTLEAITEWAFEKGPGLTEAGFQLVLGHIDAAYQRGLMAGRSQAGYRTTRKKKEDPCATVTAGAAGSTPASTTKADG